MVWGETRRLVRVRVLKGKGGVGPGRVMKGRMGDGKVYIYVMGGAVDVEG